MPKITREKFKTYENVFDHFTLRNIFRLASQGHFEELKSPISIGKEANVFSAVKKDGSFVAVKIYRLETCDFNKMYDYIKDDPRYQNIGKSRRSVIFAWAQREYRNLLKARKFEVSCPTPIHSMYNILVLEFIGKNNIAAPKLKDDIPNNLSSFYKQIEKNMINLYKSGLVHGDLSAFNILSRNNKPVFIDFSQATPTNNVNSIELLKRDCKNIAAFFRKYSLEIDEKELYKKIVKKLESKNLKTNHNLSPL